ncbi:putative alpha-L-fucosidase 1 [Selaginella moellendorffii]|nr:putative alpha-L-fucosidase 1 [Selaginella moellendorffii]|eukprot:XP_024536022.1 putative alpha-L-fucosidase 1 [Selaginella moellendorffii]
MVNRSSIMISRSNGQNEAPKSLEQLLDVFYKSSARNCLLLLNVPPNSLGLINESDFQTLERFSSTIDSIFSVNLAANPLSVTASSACSSLFGPKQILDERMETFWAPMQGESTGWIELDLGKVSKFNALEIREPVNMGQRVMEYLVEAWDSVGWYLVSNGSTIGYRKVDQLEEYQVCAACLIRLLIDALRGDSLICFFGLYFDMYNLRHLSSI